MDKLLNLDDGEFELYILDNIESSSVEDVDVDKMSYIRLKMLVTNRFYPMILNKVISEYSSSGNRICRSLAKDLKEITYHMTNIREIISVFVILSNSILNTDFNPKYATIDPGNDYYFTERNDISGVVNNIENFDTYLVKIGNLLAIYFEYDNIIDGERHANRIAISLNCTVTLYVIGNNIITLKIKCN